MNANTRHLQALIAINAAIITDKHDEMNDYVQQARAERFLGNKSLTVFYFDRANKLRSKLAKLHAKQRQYYVELDAAYREQRITAKLAKIEAAGCPSPLLPRFMTSFEKEAKLDAVLAKIA